MDDKLRDYINERYPRWLEYSHYQCIKYNIEDQFGDVLNYVLEDNITKEMKNAEELFAVKVIHRTKAGKVTYEEITQLDTYILKSIKFSIIYKSSSYQLRNMHFKRDSNVDICKVSIPYKTEIDEKLDIEEKMKRVQEMLYRIGVCDRNIRVFNWNLSGCDFR
jgi:hypothetical protein